MDYDRLKMMRKKEIISRSQFVGTHGARIQLRLVCTRVGSYTDKTGLRRGYKNFEDAFMNQFVYFVYSNALESVQEGHVCDIIFTVGNHNDGKYGKTTHMSRPKVKGTIHRWNTNE